MSASKHFPLENVLLCQKQRGEMFWGGGIPRLPFNTILKEYDIYFNSNIM